MPVPVYTSAPTTAAKADGITPKTASPPTQTSAAGPATNPATTTALPLIGTTSHPQAQPGQHPVPAPTNAFGNPIAPASNYVPSPPTPTPTQALQNSGPTPPLPGAVPVPPTGVRSNLPPPPKAGEKYNPPPQHSQPAVQQMPAQYGYNPPNPTYQPPTKSTIPASQPLRNHPATLAYHSPAVGSLEDQDHLEHPPGYHQDPAALNRLTPRHASPLRVDQDSSFHRGGTMSDAVDEESVWDSAKNLAFSVGKKVAETEAEIWKRINGEK